jgi:hydroxymethylglutaryl-CoA lyase
MNDISLIECPRDAMQGWKRMIPTKDKIEYINSLLEIGFDTIDFGSFVSPKAIPQMADTADVLKGVKTENSVTKLLAIVANERGAEEAAAFEKISYLGFPFSISPTFQLKNTNSTMEESLKRVEVISNICAASDKKLVVYLSMGFGNPYGDPYNENILLKWAAEMIYRGIDIISLADTVGLATSDQIRFALNTLIPQYPNTQIGVHLHASPLNWELKLSAALDSGCKRVDGALKGFGGCPMAQDELIGNMDTESIISYIKRKNPNFYINEAALVRSIDIATRIFV